MSALGEEESQKRGLTTVVFLVGDLKDKFRGSGWVENVKVSEVSPYKWCTHCCSINVIDFSSFIEFRLYPSTLPLLTSVQMKSASIFSSLHCSKPPRRSCDRDANYILVAKPNVCITCPPMESLKIFYR